MTTLRPATAFTRRLGVLLRKLQRASGYSAKEVTNTMGVDCKRLYRWHAGQGLSQVQDLQHLLLNLGYEIRIVGVHARTLGTEYKLGESNDSEDRPPSDVLLLRQDGGSDNK
jgi:transcriptional regulator with XRE-family HTH domain